MKAAHGRVSDIKHLSSQGITRVMVEIPAEFHVEATQLLFNKNVLVTVSDLKANYGILNSQAPVQAEGAGTSTGAAPPQSRAPGERSLGQQLHINGYFYRRKLWLALHTSGLYTVQMHKAWIETQGCIAILERLTIGPCEGDICAHHCDSADIGAAGASIQPENPQKPPHWFCVPICHVHHRNWVHGSHANSATRKEKEWLQGRAVEYMAGRAKAAMKQFLGLESLRDLTAAQLERFERHVGIAA